MNLERKVSAEGLTKAILISLATGAIIGSALLFPGVGVLYKSFTKDKWEKVRKRGTLKTTLNRLEKQEFISWKEKGQDFILILTQKGKKKILQYNMDNLRLQMPSKWDGWWRVIIFDIPEEHKPARELFRGKLISLGFKKLQRSVFVTKLPCRDEVDFLTFNLGIEKYVTYIRAKEIRGLK